MANVAEEPHKTTRKQTPRVPANFLYTRLVPLVLGAMVVLLLVVLAAVFASLLGLGPGAY